MLPGTIGASALLLYLAVNISGERLYVMGPRNMLDMTGLMGELMFHRPVLRAQDKF